MDRDTVGHRDAHREIYEAFASRGADLLIGTQMVAKGWDLPGVRLVGIVNADIALHFPDFRAAERTFSLLTQVAGRAGRGDEPAQVILQTYSPDHSAVQLASAHDYEGFAELELEARRQLHFPPFTRLLVLTRSSELEQQAHDEAELEAERLRRLLEGTGVEVMGPSPAFIPRLRSLYRWQLTIRAPRLEAVRPYLPSGRGWAIDVDPACPGSLPPAPDPAGQCRPALGLGDCEPTLPAPRAARAIAVLEVSRCASCSPARRSSRCRCCGRWRPRTTR